MRILRSRIAFSLAGFFVALLLIAAVDDTVQRMIRGHELLSGIYQRVISEYVEETSPDDLLRAGVKGMLDQLDPYAELIEEKENSEVDVLARGSYSGLGIKVGRRNGSAVVTYIYDEVRPLTNLRLGDVLLRIDSVDLRTTSVKDLRPLLRGLPGTTVDLLVRRPGIFDSLSLTVTRRQVSIDPLPFQEMLEGDIFYMKLTRFTRSAVDSIDLALKRAYAAGGVHGVIIDVRDNPGGLLESAVSLVDKFVSPGTPIVSMKGRQAAYVRSYFAKDDPIDADVPIVILVNERSASASEIVAGAMQDLDRAVILGRRTFGKGLVQTLIPLNYNAYLKLTTSRYFIPSGRCIQRLSYANGNVHSVTEDGAEEAVFRTARLARAVRESNGIVPDIVLAKDTVSPLIAYLLRHDAVFNFAASYINRKKPVRVPAIDGDMRGRFKSFVDSLSTAEGDALTDALKSLQDEARKQGMPTKGISRIQSLESEIAALRSARFDAEWKELKALLNEEFIFQLHGDAARLQASVASDSTIARARELLTDRQAWEEAMIIGHPQ